VFNDEAFTAALRTVAAGGTVLDPGVVAKLMTRLTPGEREVLALMAEGRFNGAIAQRLFSTEKAVSQHAAGISAQPGLPPPTTTTAASWPCWPISVPGAMRAAAPGVPPGSAGEIVGCGRVEFTSWRRILRLLALDRGTDGDQ
jgi:DNA-binding CsgD family transcriptional regulator